MPARTRIHDLELVVALAEERNLTQAARRLGMTQPAVTKRLHVIEGRLKLRLFETNHRGTNLTEEGRLFAEYAQQAVNQFHRGIHVARQTRETRVNRLRVGVSPFQPPQLVEILRTVEMRLYRNLEVEIESGFSCELIRKVQTREVDLALVTSPPPTPSITTVEMSTRKFMISFHESHKLAAQASLSLQDLSPFPWIFMSRVVHPYLHDLILRRVAALDLEPRIIHRIMYPEEARELVKDEPCIVWTGPMGAARLARDGSFVARPLADREIQLETHLATWATNSSPLVSDFVRSFMKRYQMFRLPVQMPLPIGSDAFELVG